MEARAATEQANARLAAVEQRFARLDQEIASIRTHAEQESAAEETRIKALMEAERQRIIASAEQEIAAAASAARRELKRFAGALAIDRAAKKISLDESGDRALLRQFVQDLGQEARFGRAKLMAAFVPRYANALADVVFDRKLDPAQVQRQLDDFAAIFAGSSDLREALLNPVLPASKRVAILDAVTSTFPARSEDQKLSRGADRSRTAGGIWTRFLRNTAWR